MSLTEYTSVEIGNRNLTIYYDPNPTCPREWVNLGTIAAFHRRYNLGDIQELRDVIDELDQSKWTDAKIDDFYYSDDLGMVVKEMEKQGFIVLPVYICTITAASPSPPQLSHADGIQVCLVLFTSPVRKWRKSLGGNALQRNDERKLRNTLKTRSRRMTSM